jgi:hypothetical protein
MCFIADDLQTIDHLRARAIWITYEPTIVVAEKLMEFIKKPIKFF